MLSSASGQRSYGFPHFRGRSYSVTLPEVGSILAILFPKYSHTQTIALESSATRLAGEAIG